MSATETLTQYLPNVPHTRMRSHDRDIAVRLNRSFNRREPHRHHIGVTTHSHIFLDLDAPYPRDACTIAAWLSLIIRDECGVFASAWHSLRPPHYWVVSKHGVDSRVWRSVYESALDTWSQQGLDIMHAKLSLRYGKSTLRITPKSTDEHIQLLYRTFPNGQVIPNLKPRLHP